LVPKSGLVFLTGELEGNKFGIPNCCDPFGLSDPRVGLAVGVAVENIWLMSSNRGIICKLHVLRFRGGGLDAVGVRRRV